MASEADRDRYVGANREAWDASAPYHRDNENWRLLVSGFAKPGFSCLDEIATQALKTIGVENKDVAQVCCNNGRELLSIRNMGARSGVGFDQAANFLEQARELAAVARQDCEFVCTDIYEIPARYNARFDLVVITIGVFGWMPDLALFLRIVAGLLRPDGQLFIYEQHPVMNMFEPTATRPFVPAASYFQKAPAVEDTVIVYDDSPREPAPRHFWFFHTLGDILTACLANGLSLSSFREYGHNISSAEFDVYEGGPIELPMSYTLLATKLRP